jgi:NADPH2:quinone reductase
MPPCDPYREADVAAEVARLTDRAGVHVAYDAVGKDTFDGSLAALSSRGHLVNYGQASGPIPPLDIARLGAKSATLSRPFLFAYISTRPELEAQAGALCRRARSSAGHRRALPLAGAAQAALENREPGPFVLDC